ncbi:patatin family protein [Photobacterium sp. WH77]|uniref:patatin-like phospholipase family protein n=1 Tax=unclassified Photobacterium TaxID=2628852 RepID=UPI001EDC7487|nr:MULTISPECIES: patatin family protein [unclassified Photobacterium]MCG2837624.1 patatin family protein [Photobacterium sp. WH77]MCG2845240.1 patatin family protein [Photobacterium sp. WH80]MDO6583039.1 patatin family protein [Photobacterium sp. 2_MG-2023]
MAVAESQALVVEGGAMRGIFAAGVLDGFLEQHYRPFDFCIGVSAGSTNLAAWLANQHGRNYKVITDYSCRPEFISLRKFIRGGHWLDLDWLWQITINEIRLDLDAFDAQPIPLYVVTTQVSSGEAVYTQATADNLEQLLKASCSVPVAYRDYPLLNGDAMTDGGVADSIPVIKAYQMGAREITVILSRPLGYRKKTSKTSWFLRRMLADTPELARVMMKRADNYNSAIEFIENPPQDCRIHVIAPPAEFDVGRITTDKKRLDTGYQMGLAAALAGR